MSLLDDIKSGAENIMNNEQVKDAINKGKEFINSEKGKETIANAKEKVEEFVSDKTHGKGILGFGKDEAKATSAKATAAPTAKTAQTADSASAASVDTSAAGIGKAVGSAINAMKSNTPDK